MNSAANEQVNVLQVATFHDHAWGTGRGVSKLATGSINQTRSCHNCGDTAIKKLNKALWRAIWALTYDLHQIIQNVIVKICLVHRWLRPPAS